MIYACLFKIDRAYGGPEEGDWWYDCGESLPHDETIPMRTFANDKDAMEWYHSKLPIVDAWNAARNSDLNSVNCEGRFVIYITNDMPESYPKETPHYE